MLELAEGFDPGFLFDGRCRQFFEIVANFVVFVMGVFHLLLDVLAARRILDRLVKSLLFGIGMQGQFRLDLLEQRLTQRRIAAADDLFHQIGDLAMVLFQVVINIHVTHPFGQRHIGRDEHDDGDIS